MITSNRPWKEDDNNRTPPKKNADHLQGRPSEGYELNVCPYRINILLPFLTSL